MEGNIEKTSVVRFNTEEAIKLLRESKTVVLSGDILNGESLFSREGYDKCISEILAVLALRGQNREIEKGFKESGCGGFYVQLDVKNIYFSKEFDNSEEFKDFWWKAIDSFARLKGGIKLEIKEESWKEKFEIIFGDFFRIYSLEDSAVFTEKGGESDLKFSSTARQFRDLVEAVEKAFSAKGKTRRFRCESLGITFLKTKGAEENKTVCTIETSTSGTDYIQSTTPPVVHF